MKTWRNNSIKLVPVIGLALALTAGLFAALQDSSPTQAHTAAGEPASTTPLPLRSTPRRSRAAPAPLLSTEAPLPGWVLALMQAEPQQTSADGLSIVAAAESSVFNGDALTFTITITNTGDEAINGILLLDALPENTLSDVHCSGGDKCELISIPVPFESRFGTFTVTTLAQITWSVNLLEPDVSRTVQFGGRVGCQADGTLVKNRAFFAYQQDGANRSGSSNETETTVRVRVEHTGQFNLSSGSTWCSTDPGGVYDLDWGDFDSDGDLDLAFGSFFGVTVYRNDAGQLTRLPPVHDRETLGVRWADFDNDGAPELLATGRYVPDDSPHPSGGDYYWTGYNYIYDYTGNDFQLLDDNHDGYTFMSNDGIFRAAATDYDKDGDLDLATANYWSGCTLLLYRNQGPADPGFLETLNFTSDDLVCLLIDQGAYDAAWGDYDNDGDSDLAAATYSSIRVFSNVAGTLTASNAITLASGFAARYDLAWGDYDGDGYLDLAAALPDTNQVLVYHNQSGGGFGATPITVTTASFSYGPLSIDWGDLNGDGQVELIVAEPAPAVYQWNGLDFSPMLTLPAGLVQGYDYGGESYYAVYGIRAADYDNDGDLDLSLANAYGPSLLFATFAPMLDSTLTSIGSFGAGSVAWGDADGDGRLDLLYGAGTLGSGSAAFGSLLFYNQDGAFLNPKTISGFGPRSVAFGDVNGDGRQDMAFGTSSVEEVYLAGDLQTAEWTSVSDLPSWAVAWGDTHLDDVDGQLDLLVGNAGPLQVYLNQGAQLGATPVWTAPQASDTRSVAWGDLDNDGYLDFAVGNSGESNQVYCNNRDNSFTQIWSAPVVSDTRSLAWGDYDGDGDMDLAVGNYGAANLLYRNLTCDTRDCTARPFLERTCQEAVGLLEQTPVWRSDELSRTTALAWGDWDNDGDPDLAVGNAGEAVQVYANLLSTPDEPDLFWLWASADAPQATGIAWGDRDGDGDMDLALSQSGGANGTYENHYVAPMHLSDSFTRSMPLPDNPTYLSIPRPGDTDDAYLFSSSELLAGPLNHAVEIRYTLFDPDGSRSTGPDQAGNPVVSATYEFSLDGGGAWQPATGAGDSMPLTTTRLGQSYSFWWDAVADQAVSDDARFRISVVPGKQTGPVQRGLARAISPPFRVRGLSCQWPRGASIQLDPLHPQVGDPVRLEGQITAGSGVLTFTWDFGDTYTATGQIVQHAYSANNTYGVTLTVSGEPCPITEPAVVTTTIVVGTGVPDSLVYLPLLFQSSSGSTAFGPTLGPPAQARRAGPVGQVAGLSGEARPGAGATHLAWKPKEGVEMVQGYRIYRRSRTEGRAFQLLATTPAGVHVYTDETAFCGYIYYVTAFDAAGESPPSAASFFSLPCQN